MRKVSRARAKCVPADSSADPVLLFTALLLLAVLGIAEANIHRDSLREFGVVISNDISPSQFAAP